ncbi:MAG: hypothetical protein POELPBGB_01887 [Bacteroidia bacterium]|nr:hypothetical protein [Bacteroidia bacterium]
MKLYSNLFILLCFTSTVFSQNSSNDETFSPPEFKGGVKEFHNYLDKYLKYPQLELENGVEGDVLASFAVGSSGEIDEVEIITANSPGFAKEVKRALILMPPWESTKINGTPTETLTHMQIYFSINKSRVKNDNETYECLIHSFPINEKSIAQKKEIAKSQAEGKDFYDKGVIELENKNNTLALDYFNRAEQQGLQFIDLYYNRALANYRAGNKDAGCKDWLEAARMGDAESLNLFNAKCSSFVEATQPVAAGEPLIYAEEPERIAKSVIDKFKSTDFSGIQTLQELAEKISQITLEKREQLQMLLLWSHENMNVDTVRFFNGGSSLTTANAFKNRIGLCDEYSNIVNDFCNQLNIPSLIVDGYVKDASFEQGKPFEEINHTWNAVKIDSSWVLCDLFWSTCVLMTNDSKQSRFEKKLNALYFLSTPDIFIENHLPGDPIFQFDNFPIKVNAFTSSEKTNLSMERMPYLNYSDSIKILMKLNNRERTIHIAQHAYAYNKNNPNSLISAYYNYGVAVLNNKSSPKQDLLNAKKYFTSALLLIEKSNKIHIIALRESCQKGLEYINKRLSSL